jgi:hypothetical protein
MTIIRGLTSVVPFVTFPLSNIGRNSEQGICSWFSTSDLKVFFLASRPPPLKLNHSQEYPAVLNIMYVGMVLIPVISITFMRLGLATLHEFSFCVRSQDEHFSCSGIRAGGSHVWQVRCRWLSQLRQLHGSVCSFKWSCFIPPQTYAASIAWIEKLIGRKPGTVALS